jgi:hypothetical protein
VDNISNGVNKVDLYGGWAWGYDYTAYDTPEPSTAGLLCFGALMIGVLQAARVKRLEKASGRRG